LRLKDDLIRQRDVAKEKARKRRRQQEDLDNAANSGVDGNGVIPLRARKRKRRREGDEVDNAADDGDGDDGDGDDGNGDDVNDDDDELMNETTEKDVGKETDMEAGEPGTHLQRRRGEDSFGFELRSLVEAEDDVLPIDSIN